jgi:hypothetical protein
VVALAVVGFLAGGAPAGTHLGAWAIGGLIPAAAVVAAYVTLLRFDLTMLPIAFGVTATVATLARAAGQPYPGAGIGSILAVALVTLIAAGWFRALRTVEPPAVAPAV